MAAALERWGDFQIFVTQRRSLPIWVMIRIVLPGSPGSAATNGRYSQTHRFSAEKGSRQHPGTADSLHG
jgi:hypothetical protein